LNCPKTVILNQSFTCQLQVVSFTQSFQVVVDFGDGEIQTHSSLVDQTISISKTYTKLGSYVINAHVAGQNMHINPEITVTNVFGYDGEQFTLNCPSNTVLLLNNIFFGRKEINCVDTTAPNAFRTHCNNKTSCSISVGTVPVLVDACPGTLKYLTLNYDCIGNDYNLKSRIIPVKI
jgi:hypothetical protein